MLKSAIKYTHTLNYETTTLVGILTGEQKDIICQKVGKPTKIRLRKYKCIFTKQKESFFSLFFFLMISFLFSFFFIFQYLQVFKFTTSHENLQINQSP